MVEWFTGNVTEALSVYQEKNGILIVYIHHPEDANNVNTNKFNELWDQFDKSIILDVPTVFMRMRNDSEGAIQFSQFFPTPIFPVCYVIGLNGQPLEVITPAEELTLTRLNESLKKSVNLYRDQLNEKSKASESTAVAQNAQNNASKTASETNNSTANSSDTNLEERIRYARERLEEKRKAEEAKKKAEQLEKELARRNEGKLMTDAREKQKERELKEAMEKRRREKEADAQALKALREKIKKDKEERARKAAGSAATEPDASADKAPEPSVINKPVDVDECRIQCRFSNGQTLVKTFPSKGTLQLIINAVKEDGRQAGEFFLVQAYPRRQLNEMDKTLMELGLTPSSTLLVIAEEKNARGQLMLQSGSTIGYFQLLFGFFYVLYAPFAALFRYVGIGGNTTSPASTSVSTSGTSATNERRSASSLAQSSSNVYREGRIGRLRDDGENSSDNEATWNGNSTQQL